MELGLRYQTPSGGAGPDGQVGPLTPGHTSTTGGTGGQRAQPEEAMMVERKPEAGAEEATKERVA
jgi:hypothetical protein